MFTVVNAINKDSFCLFTVTLSANNTAYFEGFLIEARNAAALESGSVGTFTLLDSSISQLLTCDHREVSNPRMFTKAVRLN